MKYIILAETSLLPETPVIFPDTLRHACVARAHGETVAAAGFVKLTPEGVVCYGESDSLHITSRPQDAECIALAFGIAAPAPQRKATHRFDILGLRTL